MESIIDGIVILTENKDINLYLKTTHHSSVAITFASMLESHRYFALYLKEVSHLYIDLDSPKAPADSLGFMKLLWEKKPDLKIILVSKDIHRLIATGVDQSFFKLLPTTNFKS